MMPRPVDLTVIPAQMFEKYKDARYAPKYVDIDSFYLQELGHHSFLKKELKDEAWSDIESHLERLQSINEKIMTLDREMVVGRTQFILEKNEDKQNEIKASLRSIPKEIREAFKEREALITRIKELHLELLQKDLIAVRDSPRKNGLQREIDQLISDPIVLRERNINFLAREIYKLTDSAIESLDNSETSTLQHRASVVVGNLMQENAERKMKPALSQNDTNPYPNDPDLVNLYSKQQRIEQEIKSLFDQVQPSLKIKPFPPELKTQVESLENSVAARTLYNEAIRDRTHLLRFRPGNALKVATDELYNKLALFMRDLDTLEQHNFKETRNHWPNEAITQLATQIYKIMAMLEKNSIGLPESQVNQMVSALRTRFLDTNVVDATSNIPFTDLLKNLWSPTGKDLAGIKESRDLISELLPDNGQLMALSARIIEHQKFQQQFNTLIDNYERAKHRVEEQIYVYSIAEKQKLIEGFDDQIRRLTHTMSDFTRSFEGHTEDLFQGDDYQTKMELLSAYHKTISEVLDQYPNEKELFRELDKSKSLYEQSLSVFNKQFNTLWRVYQDKFTSIDKPLDTVDMAKIKPFIEIIDTPKLPIATYEEQSKYIQEHLDKILQEQFVLYRQAQIVDLNQRIKTMVLPPNPALTEGNPYQDRLTKAVGEFVSLREINASSVPDKLTEFLKWRKDIENQLTISKRQITQVTTYQRQASAFESHGNTQLYQSINTFLRAIEKEFLNIAKASESKEIELELITQNPLEFFRKCNDKRTSQLNSIDSRLAQLVTMYQQFSRIQASYRGSIRTEIERATKTDLAERCMRIHQQHETDIKKQINDTIAESKLVNPGWVTRLIDMIKTAFGKVADKVLGAEDNRTRNMLNIHTAERLNAGMDSINSSMTTTKVLRQGVQRERAEEEGVRDLGSDTNNKFVK